MKHPFKLQNLLLIAMLIMVAASAYAAFPQITQVTYTPSPAVPGSTITVLIQLQNNDASVQKGVTINVENAYPFTVKTTDTNPNPNNMGDIDKYATALATFTIYVDPTAENKTYELPITITTADGTTGKKTSFPIVINGKEPTLKVVGINDDVLLPGQEKEMIYTIQNVGTSPAYDVILEMQEDRTITATGVVVGRDITPVGAATAYLPSINPGEQKTATLKVSVNTSAAVENYTLPIQISYRNAAGARTTDISYIGIRVFGNAELDAELKDITGNTAAGQTANITIEVFNKGLGKASFVLAEVSTQDGTIDKPRQFIGTLAPNDVDTLQTTATFTKSGDHTINVTINYQDADSAMKTVTIPVLVKAQTATDTGISPIVWIIVIIIIVALVWNFFFRGKKKK